ncbi:TonB-linked SusC/RagA family outer membrane protein [Dysgonomonas hofstadii]|uniref:TonB-linked SusC/RagA family outer membrane protein n=1 Tax=Dysgonomonas hofstadii TaxID=637886 RepID=A0A840CDW9_9BACT|nr:TonB-dependent receptor [Dysgonomonas hofstadii]MBB4034177.1 TonB-linked SusC/RagA family outer membrane protein [Dysgonomonas hofstadii]
MNFMSAFFCRKKHSWDRSRKLFLFLLFSIAFLNVENLHAQTDHINGQVLDQDGAPLIGVTVAVKDKNTGVFTDEAGLFSIRAVNGDILIFTMISMKTTEVKVEKGKPIRIIMKPDEATLEEVVVVGYGKQKKVTITGSVSSIDMDDIKVPVANLSNALQGRVAGIISVQSSGEPGYDNSTFTIRGIGTFTGNTSPLVIVDGVQRDDVNSTYGGAYNNIDPEDIQSISLLKDASATAVYGAKGANGVLIINTKRGQAGKPRISFKVETGLTSFTIKPKILDGVNYMKLYNEGRRNMGLEETYSQEQIMKTASGLDPYLYPNVNWMNEIYKNNSSITNVNLNINGGGEAVRYYLSASFYNQTGPYKVKNENGFNPNLDYKRYDFRSNVDVNLTPSTLLQMNIAAMLVDSRYPGISAGNLWYLAYSTSPVAYPVRYPDGRWAGPTANAGNNPKNEVQNNGYTTEFNPSVQSVFTLNQKLDFITEGLTSYARFSFDSYSQFYNKRTGGVDLWRATGRDGDGNLIFGNPVKEGQQFLGYEQSSTGERVTYLEANLAYDRAFDRHRIGAMLLYNMRNRLVSTAGDVIGSIPFRNQVVAGRLSYVFDDKYMTEFNASYTGSENFAKGNKFGFFPAVSAGWLVSNEKFFEPINKTINLLKIRASYGVVGNDNIANNVRFAYLTQIGGGNKTGFGLSGTNYWGIKSNVLGVEDLTWEKSYKTNIGLELGFFDKVNLTMDIFKERRKQILIERASLPGMAGFDTRIYANMGEMDNNGFDANLEYNDQIGKVGIRVYGNITYSKNKIVYQDEPTQRYGYMSATGRRAGEYIGYIDQGLFVDQDDIDSHPPQFGVTVRPGDIKYMNLNPNDDAIIDTYDRTYLGKSWFPTWSYGAGFNLRYMNFDLSLFFQGIADVGIMANGSGFSAGDWGVAGAGVLPFSGNGQYPNNVLENMLDRWTEENPRQDAYYPRLSYNSKLEDNNYVSSTRWLKDGSYLRLKQASFGYTLDHPSIRKAGLSYLYFYVSGQNLLTFSKFKLWDPELGSNGAKYPLTRMITFGIRAQF